RDLARRAAQHAPGLPPIVPVQPRPERIPLSDAQQRMWFLNQYDTASAIYNMPMAVRLAGDVDIDALIGAIHDVIARHEVLRTVFPAVDGEPHQRVIGESEALERFDWERVDTFDDLTAAADRGFDVTVDLPVRGRLRVGDDGTGELLLVVHHIAFDGESIGVLIRDVLAAYARRTDPAVPAQPPLAVQYADYAIWQHAELGRVDDPDTVLGRQLAYWREKLTGLPALTELPMDRPRPPVFDSDGGMVVLEVDEGLTERITELCRTYEVTPFMVTYAALAVLVARLGATSDAVIASPAAGRLSPAVDDLVGMFVNTLVLRTDTSPGQSVDALLHRVREDVLDAFDNVAVQFDDLVEALAPPRSTAYSPLAQIAFTYAEAGPGDGPIAVGGMRAEAIEVTGHEAKFDLMVLAHGRTETAPLRIEFLYARALYDESTVERFGEVYRRILEQMTADQSVAIGDIDIVGPAEAPTPATAVAAPRATVGAGGEVQEGTLLHILAERDLDPHHPALICDGTEIAYEEFERRTDAVARALLARGVRPDDVVAVGMERSIDSVVAVWGVIKSGAAYLSIDPAYPDDRIAYMLEDSNVDFGITVAATRDRLGESACEWVELDALAAEASGDGPITSDERNGSVRLGNLAYVIYTSGSTGRPKGVAVSNTGMADLVANYGKVTGAREDDPDTRVLHVASPSFDASFFEMCWAISAGHTLVIAPHSDFAGEALDAVLERGEVTDMVITPSVLATLDPERAEFVRNLATAGESCPPDLVERWAARGRRLFNFYGPSETTVWATRARMMPDKPITIGRAIGGFTARVLDPRLHEVPRGVVGELYLSADGLARGYLGRPRLTATSFVADPSGPAGARMYATGDMVRVTPQGDLEFAGRADHQVKINGQRVELGEIEAVLASAPGVAQAVAVGRPTDQGGRTHMQVVAYLVARPGESVDREAAVAHAATRLAAHMIPSHVMVIDEIPLTPARKTDLRALPEPVIEVGEHVPPADDRERAVAAVVADILELDDVSVTASFFDLGGNSLLATRLAARAGEALGAKVTVRDVFDAPTVRALVEATAGRTDALVPLTKADPRPPRVPLSFAQQRIWFINRFEEGSAAYNIPTVLRLSGPVDAEALRRALVDVVMRHEVLRTVFPADDEGVPFQLVDDPATVADRLDWAVVSSRAELDAAVGSGFDLTTQWPLRVRLWSAGADEHLLALVVQHIAADGESLLPLVGDLVTAYQARVAGTAPAFAPLPVQFADFALWQHQVLGAPDDPESVVGRQVAYWRETLKGAPPLLELPTDRPRPAVASQRGAQTRLSIPADTGARVLALAKSSGATPFMVVHAALAAVLSRLAGADEVVVSTPIAGRGRAALDPLVGMFVNTLLLRTPIAPDESFDALLARVRTADLEAFEHSDVPFEAVVDAVNPVRSEAFAPLSQVMLSYNPGAAVDATAIDAAGMRVTGIEALDLPEQLDLTVTVASSADGDWTADVSYAVDLFDEPTARAIGRRFVEFLDAVTADPELAVAAPSLLNADERAAALTAARGRTVAVPDSTVADLVAEQVARTPDAEALAFEGEGLTYREFGARVATLARELIAAGVGPERTVAVCIDRSLEMMLALHAVVAAGGQYVPIDPTTPHERVAHMAEITGAEVLLLAAGTDPAATSLLAERLTVVRADASAAVDPTTTPVTQAERLAPLRPDHAVYTMFTSGSTGQPKGVTVSHRALVSHMAYISSTRVQGSAKVTLVKTPYTFDPCVVEIFWGVSVGARVVVAAPGGHRDVDYLARLIRDERIEMVDAVPVVWSMMLDSDALTAVLAESSLHGMLTGGEALPASMAQRAADELPDVDLVNQYGPTEATNFVLNHLVVDPQQPYIGRPVWNTTALVLDSRLGLVPDGVVGELYLGGAQLARGYAAQSRLTAERFVPDPYGEPGARLYRTGDLVRRTPDGAIDYVGRVDYQVKLRGQRIELGEIEEVLARAPGVVLAAAAVAPGPGGDALVGYVSGTDLDLDAVRDYAARHLMAYMCPTAWVEVAEMPLGSAGKIDRKALPEPDFSVLEGEYEAPEGEAEQAVADVFADVLGVERVSATESFFDIGGNSLSAMRVVARAGEALGVELSVRDLFDAPTVRGLVAGAAGRGDTLEPVTAVDPRPELVPLSYAQQRMWFINRLEPDLPTYNIPIALRLTGALDVAALRAAVGDLVARHESLRTTFPAVDGRPFQKVHPADSPQAAPDWAVVDDEAALADAAGTGFDVTARPPFRVRLWQAGPDEWVLVAVIHHIVGDGESMTPLLADMIVAYGARAAGQAPRFEPLPVQFADYALWQHRVLGDPSDADSIVGRQLDRWEKTLRGLPELVEIPTDRPRPPVASHRGGTVDLELPAALGARIEEVARARGVTPFMVVHAALAVLVARSSATADIAVATPIAGRGQRVLDPIIGMFVNTLVLRSQVRLDMTFDDLLDQVRGVDLEAFAHADVPFEALVERLNPVRSQSFTPLTQVMLTVDYAPSSDFGLGADGLEVAVVPPPVTPAQVDLTFDVRIRSGQTWTVSIAYALDLYDESTVSTLGGRFAALLDALTSAPAQPVALAPLLDEHQRALIAQWSVGPARPNAAGTIPEIVR
ncbi:amino acid adenylation domain-containing protein, partial [Gordonia sp. (in: high G+C Gram-positive bacteria)]|uniref:amino acid adenylation domain-containing protein n=1 Tax=Gordonia sp. (in: high G+C Gram-positive bacteria) TaxID=84139 RepID=UPI0039E6EAC4